MFIQPLKALQKITKKHCIYRVTQCPDIGQSRKVFENNVKCCSIIYEYLRSVISKTETKLKTRII